MIIDYLVCSSKQTLLLFLLIIGLIYEKLKYLLSQKIYSQTNLGHGKLPSLFVSTCTYIANSLIITFSPGETKVFYKKEVGAGTAVKETPEIERVKKNQQNISSVSVINYSSVSKWWSNIFSHLVYKKSTFSFNNSFKYYSTVILWIQSFSLVELALHSSLVILCPEVEFQIKNHEK